MSEALPERPQRLLLIGTLPPPYGGVTVHVSRLAEAAAAAGIATTVLNLRPKHQDQQGAYSVVRCGNRWKAVLVCCSRPERDFDLIHFHASRVRTLVALNVVRALSAGQRPFVVTLHSGQLERELGEITCVERLLLRKIMSRTAGVICVNENIAELISSRLNVGSDRLRIIPAFLPGNREALRAQNAEKVAVFRRTNWRATIASSGCGTPLYGWSDLLFAVRSAGSDIGWIFCVYDRVDDDYFRRITQEAATLPNVLVLRDLSPGEFLTVISSSTVYVRATVADGDAVAVREALGLGLHVLASDAVPRPSGTLIYNRHDPVALSAGITQVLNEYGVSRPQPDFAGAVFGAYREFMLNWPTVRSGELCRVSYSRQRLVRDQPNSSAEVIE